MNNGYGDFIKTLIGVCLLVTGIAFVLSFWGDVIGLLKGIVGPALAMAGLLVLYSLKVGVK